VETLDVSNQRIYQMPDGSYKVYMTVYNKGSVDSQITSITVYDETGTGNAVSIAESSTVLKQRRAPRFRARSPARTR